MPQQIATSTENNFTKGLVTEFTGLNFPENAATDCDNVTFDITGNVYRRLGIDYETNYTSFDFGSRADAAINTYKWNNAGGDGNVQIVVCQVGTFLRFYRSSSATTSLPLSTQWIGSVDVSSFVANGLLFSSDQECQFTDGNGYLFVYHPDCEPFYCTYIAGVIAANVINVKIRDFVGAIDNLEDNIRPSTLTDPHNYNLQNQGWVSGNPWSLTSTTSVSITTGVKIFTVAAGVTGISPGQTITVQPVGIPSGVQYYMLGTVTSYAGTTLTLSISTAVGSGSYANWTIVPGNTGYINDWFTDIGNYPSNADQWWRFKNASGVFDPATTQVGISVGLGAAPKGHFILNAFEQYRSLVTGLNISQVVAGGRPTNGTWFQGRVWYTGLNYSAAATSTTPYTTWTENIYFSQVVIKPEDFGKCYQTNDPTSEELFDLLPTDGGVIVIQGCGAIYKLFPTQNGLLVFAANGVWFITGSQGIGFSAVDYTVTKISSIGSLSTTSFVDVEGLPYFWNEEGIYAVQPREGGGLAVLSMTFDTIGTFYSEIPKDSKRYARGAYDPINYTIQWIYRVNEAATVFRRYSFNRIMNYNVRTKAFYPYSVTDNQDTFHQSCINGINWVQGPGGSTSPSPRFKYFCSFNSAGIWNYQFADEHDELYYDWRLAQLANFTSYYVTGYKIRGQGMRKFQVQYLQMWSNVDDVDSGYKVQGIWDYSISGDSGRWTTIQNIDLDGTDNYGVVHRRHKIRGNGYSVQFKVTSQNQKPFDVIGWAVVDTVNQGT